MRYLILLIFILSGPIAHACRDNYDSEWRKPESSLIKRSDWISAIEVISIEEKQSKKEYTYKVIKEIKGHNPNGSNNGKIGSFPSSDSKSYGAITWRSKNCVQNVSMEQGKRYILFSISDNPNSFQEYKSENEERIKKELTVNKK